MENLTEENNEGFQEQVVGISRVAKVVKGGRRFSFSALVVVGNKKDQIGFGVGKAGEVPDAIKKAADQARKNLVYVHQSDDTIPYEVIGKFGASKVVMYPAKQGKGIIAGGAVRTIIELSGVKNIVCKIHGSKNNHNVVRATVDGLKQLRAFTDFADARGLTLENLFARRRSNNRKVRHEEATKQAGE